MNALKKVSLILFLVFCLNPLSVPQTSAQTGTLYFDPNPLVVPTAGGSGAVNIMLSGVDRLSAFDVQLTFDPTMIQVNNVEFSPSLGGSKLGPAIDNTNGSVVFGAYTFERDADNNFVNILGGQPSPALLASISLTAINEGNSIISFTKVNTLDTTIDAGGNPIPITVGTIPGSVQISPTGPTATPTPTPPPTSTPTPLPTATPKPPWWCRFRRNDPRCKTQTPTPKPTPSPTATPTPPPSSPPTPPPPTPKPPWWCRLFPWYPKCR